MLGGWLISEARHTNNNNALWLHSTPFFFCSFSISLLAKVFLTPSRLILFFFGRPIVVDFFMLDPPPFRGSGWLLAVAGNIFGQIRTCLDLETLLLTLFSDRFDGCLFLRCLRLSACICTYIQICDANFVVLLLTFVVLGESSAAATERFEGFCNAWFPFCLVLVFLSSCLLVSCLDVSLYA